MSGSCEHEYFYAGYRYAHGSTSRPGTAAVNRYYAHVYRCKKCLDLVLEMAPRTQGSFEEVQEGAVMASVKEWDLMLKRKGE